MSGHFFRANRWLVAAAVLVCILSGGLFTRSAAAPSRDHSENSTGVLIAENTKDNKSTQTTEKVTDGTIETCEGVGYKVYKYNYGGQGYIEFVPFFQKPKTYEEVKEINKW